MRFWDETEETHDEEHSAETAETVQVERSTTDTAGHEEPSTEYTSHVDSVLSHGEIECLVCWYTGLLQEVSRVTRERISRKILNCPDHADNLGPSSIGAFEAIQIRSSGCDLLLKSRGMNHHGNCLVGIKIGFAVQGSEAEERFLGIFKTALSYQPPWRFRSHQNTHEERNRPHPLESIRNLQKSISCE